MKRQKLTIKVVDHRDGTEEEYYFTSHREYLRKMKEIVGEPGVDVSEKTKSVVHLYDQRQGELYG